MTGPIDRPSVQDSIDALTDELRKFMYGSTVGGVYQPGQNAKHEALAVEVRSIRSDLEKAKTWGLGIIGAILTGIGINWFRPH